MAQFAFRDPVTHRYYEGEDWSRIHEDFRPAFGNPDDTTNAAKYPRETAEQLRFIGPFLGMEMVEV